MIDRVIFALKKAGLEVIVTPFEADAQLSYLARTGYVDAVITEDSDLLAYGCPRVIVKMDQVGIGQEIDLTEIVGPPVAPRALLHVGPVGNSNMINENN
eukprot:Trichotokara_eunicae@DN10304_c0_g1_i1.p1